MADNDSDYEGELQELSHEPIPDDLVETDKVPIFEEQKSLGSLLRGPTPSASASGFRGKASDTALY